MAPSKVISAAEDRPLQTDLTPDEAYGLLRSLLSNVPGAIYRVALEDGLSLRLIGDEIERITGYPVSEFIANVRRSFDSIIHPEDRDRVHREVHEALDANEPYVLEYRIVTATGEVRWITDRGLRAVDAFGRECLDGIIFDVTPRREAEEARLRSEAAAARAAELEASRARIVAAADAARRRLERDLHDGAQQRLVALRIELGLMEDLATRDPEACAHRIRELERAVDETLEELRSLAHGVCPPLLADRGLAEALQAAATHATVPVEFVTEDVGRYPPEVETAVYFCVLEALQNVAKHAQGASRVALQLHDDRHGDLAFSVRDNGAGASDGALRGAGITNMNDRIAAIGGRLQVVSRPGIGTTVRARVPVSTRA
jgi:PAS domain S-box-containing protein